MEVSDNDTNDLIGNNQNINLVFDGHKTYGKPIIAEDDTYMLINNDKRIYNYSLVSNTTSIIGDDKLANYMPIYILNDDITFYIEDSKVFIGSQTLSSYDNSKKLLTPLHDYPFEHYNLKGNMLWILQTKDSSNESIINTLKEKGAFAR